MARHDPEWRILRELAKQPAATPELRAGLSQDAPVSSYVLTARLSLLRSWGWLRSERSVGRHPSVRVYTITKQGLRALSIAQRRNYATSPLALEQELQGPAQPDVTATR